MDEVLKQYFSELNAWSLDKVSEGFVQEDIAILTPHIQYITELLQSDGRNEIIRDYYQQLFTFALVLYRNWKFGEDADRITLALLEAISRKAESDDKYDIKQDPLWIDNLLRILPGLVEHCDYNISQGSFQIIFNRIGTEVISSFVREPDVADINAYLSMIAKLLEKNFEFIDAHKLVAFASYVPVDPDHPGFPILSKLLDGLADGTLSKLLEELDDGTLMYDICFKKILNELVNNANVKTKDVIGSKLDYIVSRLFALSQKSSEFLWQVLEMRYWDDGKPSIWDAIAKKHLEAENIPTLRALLANTNHEILIEYAFKLVREDPIIKEFILDVPPSIIKVILHIGDKHKPSSATTNLDAILNANPSHKLITQIIRQVIDAGEKKLFHTIIDKLREKSQLEQLLVSPDFIAENLMESVFKNLRPKDMIEILPAIGKHLDYKMSVTVLPMVFTNVLKLFNDQAYIENISFHEIINLSKVIYDVPDLQQSVVTALITLSKNSIDFAGQLLTAAQQYTPSRYTEPDKVMADSEREMWQLIAKKLLEHDNLLDLRSLACEGSDVMMLFDLIALIERSGDDAMLQKFIIDLPSFRTIRVILGYLSNITELSETEPAYQHFKKQIWILLTQIFTSETGKKALEQFTAEALVGWPTGSSVNYEVMCAAAKLFNLEEKIKVKATTDKRFNPLVLSIERLGYLDSRQDGVMAHYIQNPADFKYLADLDVADKLLILSELYIFEDDFATLENYDTFLNDFISHDILENINRSFILNIIEIRYNANMDSVPRSLIELTKRLGYVYSDSETEIATYDRFVAYLKHPQKLKSDPIEALLAVELQVELLMPERTTITGLQSSHDETLEKLFDKFVQLRGANQEAYNLTDAATQVNYIRTFTLFDLYRTNPHAKIFKELLTVPLIRALFENNRDFPQFFQKYISLRPDQTVASGLLYTITGETADLSTSKKAAIDASLAENYADDFAQQSMISLRSVRGVADAKVKSNFLIDAKLRAGTVALISYIYSSPSDLRELVNGHEDIVNILMRLPRDTGSRMALFEVYMANKDLPFKYEQYQALLESIFAERMQHNRNNICQYMGQSLTAYSETSQSCVTGCKVRMFTLLLGDMFYGVERSRLSEINTYIYEQLLQQIQARIKDINHEQKLIILSQFLSSNKYNASLAAVGKRDEMVANYPVKHLDIRPINELFGVDSLDVVFAKFRDGFNADVNYNLEKKLSSEEELVMRSLLMIGGGDAVIKRINEQFQPKQADVNEVERMLWLIKTIVSTPRPSQLSAASMVMVDRKIKDAAQMIYDWQHPENLKTDDPKVVEKGAAEYSLAESLVNLARDKQEASLRSEIESIAPRAYTQAKTEMEEDASKGLTL